MGDKEGEWIINKKYKNIRGRTARGGAVAKLPQISLSSGPIEKYMFHEVTSEKKVTETDRQSGTCWKQSEVKEKRGQSRSSGHKHTRTAKNRSRTGK